MSIAIVVSDFNPEVTSRLQEGALSYLQEHDYPAVQTYHVPGAYEIPLAAKALLETKKVDAVIALGAVIRGETSHYDYVCNAVERGCSQLQLEFTKPVVFGVLTTENEEQAFDRLGGKYGHKGREAAQTALQMLALLKDIKK